MSSAMERKERDRLQACLGSIDGAIDSLEKRLRDYAGGIQTRKEYLREARRDMGRSKKIALRLANCTARMAKGLEFGQVVIADASARQYPTELDRTLLNVACTRAMHRLLLISVGDASPLLP